MKRATMLCLAALLAACGPDAAEQAAAPAEEDHDELEEIIEARQRLMIQARVSMLPIDKARLGEDFDLREARKSAEVITSLMTAAPFLYPEGTDSETPNGDAQSLALPVVWERMEDFHQMAERTAAMANTMVLIDNEAIFRERAAELREACNACHAMFQEGYD